MEFEKPSCQGEFKPPVVNASCHAACGSQADAKLQCTKPSASVSIEGSPKLAATLRKFLPAVIDIVTERSGRMLASVKAIGETGAELKGPPRCAPPRPARYCTQQS